MTVPRFAFLLAVTLAATTAGAGEEWGMRPREDHPTQPPAPSEPNRSDDLTPLLGKQLAALKRQPENTDLRKAAWVTAMRLGLFAQAAALDAPLSADERRAMEGDLIAIDIRYGIVDTKTLRGKERFLRLDKALTATDPLAAEFFAGKAPDGEDQRRLTDRLSALAARRRAADAVVLYETLRQRDIPVPLWAERDIAGSYLELRRPQEALSRYRQVVAANPDDFDANLGLFYALVETEQLDAATEHIDRYAAHLPEHRHLDGRYNGERLSADITADRVRLFADRLAEAQTRIDARHAAIPYNSEARASSASLALARGWPRQGDEMLRRTIGSDPINPSLHADLAENRLTLQDWPAARAALDYATDLDAENGAVRRARRSFELYDSYELYIEAGYGEGQDVNYFGSRDWSIDTFLYSRPIADSWRAFAHNYSASADFYGDNQTWIRSGAGIEWRQNDWRLTGEINGGSGVKAGATGTVRWKPDDQWSFYGAAESVTNQIPLRAVADGIYASRASLGTDWQQNESRKLALGAFASDFSDGNLRSGVNASWFERWASGPKWMFETTLGADTSRNSLDTSVNYFNPKSDRSLWLTAAVENLTWRSYDHSFRQRLALTGGTYWQEYYGSGAIEAIEYTHRWELDRDLSLRYGIGRLLRPYDGEREGRTFANLVMLWRF
ncbi:MAG: poly-beta-1,6 N-acetyl-D-glucosamine export porin PgaA [Dechloromonas sp.]|nr:poly-beta-1,6 N-acetyl-D-glucosamine export porin PgaA [Dechloromonas sp.]